MASETDLTEQQPGWLRAKIDWLFVLAGLSLLPWIVIYSADMWLRTDYKIFVLLLLLPLGLVLWRGRIGNVPEPARWQASLVLWTGAGLLSLWGSLWFSPWLALAAWGLVWLAWTLGRLTSEPGTRVVSWGLPYLMLLAFPISDANDPLFSLTAAVTSSASSLLDMLAVPQMPIEQSLDLRSGRLDITALCRGLGNPYVLLTFSVCLCLITRPSFFLCVLTVASVPLWAWGGGVLLAVVGSVLAENFQLHVLFGWRLWIMQAVVLVINLLCIWLTQRAVVSLAAPFEAHSAGVGGWHKVFNRIVLFPASDPLRSRRPRQDADKAPKRLPTWRKSPTIAALGSLACLFAIAGIISVWRLASQTNGYQVSQLITQPQISTSQIEALLSQSALPAELQGMQLISYDLAPAPGSAAAQGWSGRWTFASEQQTLQLTLVVPARGFNPRERQWLIDGSSLLEPRKIKDETASLSGNGILMDQLLIQDPVVGPSYLAYATWSPHTALRRDMEIGKEWGWRNWQRSLTYQPTTLSLSLFAAGNAPESPERQQDYRQILLTAVKHLQQH
jgi:hypothetical protein